MDYFARLVRQSQLSIETGEPAPQASATPGIDQGVASDLIEIDTVRESVPDATVARAPMSGGPLPPDLPAPETSSIPSQPPAASLDSKQARRGMPADDVQPGHHLRQIPAATTDAADPRAAPTRVLREVIEWIAAGPPAAPASDFKTMPKPAPTMTPASTVSIERPVEHRQVVQDEIETLDAVTTISPRIAASEHAHTPAVRRIPAKSVSTREQTVSENDVPRLVAPLPLLQERSQPAENISETEETLEVSIGTLSVHIEAPTRQAPTPPAPIAASPTPPARTSGRLQRHYLRP